MRVVRRLLFVGLLSAWACSRPAPNSLQAPQQAATSEARIPVTFELLPSRHPAILKAIEESDLFTVKALLDAGADPNTRGIDINEGWPAIAEAMRVSDAIVELLLQRGADPNIRWCDDDSPAIPPSADGAKIQPPAIPPKNPTASGCTQANGVTPLMYAAAIGSEEFERLLVLNKANPDLRDWRGLTAADYWGVKSGSRSLCATPAKDDLLGRDAALLAQGDPYWGERDNRVFKAVGPLSGPNVRLTASTDERVCGAAARAVARHHTPPDGLVPRRILPVMAIRVGRVWVVGRPDSTELGVFDAEWRMIDWSYGPS